MSKKILALCMAAVLLASVAGCASDTKPGSSTASSSSASTASSSQAESSTSTPEQEPEADGVSYPVTDANGYVVKYYMPFENNSAKYIRDHGENEAYIEAQKRTGISVDFIHPTIGQEKEQYAVLFASGEYPDIIAGQSARGFDEFYKGGIFKGVSDGVFLDLTDELAKYAPDYLAVVNELPEVKREMTDDNGRIAGFYKIKPGADPYHMHLMFLENVLTDCGFTEAPTNPQEYEQFFAACKEKGIIGMIPGGSSPASKPYDENMMGMYNLLTSGWGKDENDKVFYSMYEPRYKEYLTLMADWYAKGYISSDFVSSNEAQKKEAFYAGKLGAFWVSTVAAYNDAETLGLKVVTSPFPRLNADDKIHWMISEAKNARKCETAIAATSKRPDLAMKFLNYFFTEEGSLLGDFGVEGVHYTMVDGKPQFTDKVLNNPDVPVGSANTIFRLHGQVKLARPDVEALPSQVISPDSIALREKFWDDANVDDAYDLPNVRFSDDELARRTKIMADVETYASEMSLQFITGAIPMTEFDAYIAALKDMGVEDAIALTQEAYNRFLQKTI